MIIKYEGFEKDEDHKYNDAEGDVEVDIECANDDDEGYCDGDADDDNDAEHKRCSLC